tara:strand:+ start:261 stop:416 length:156 start_codon:yes stop_codon:yes gene_type:complete
MSETELGHLWDVTPEKGDINKFVQEMPNYEDTNKMEKTPIYSEECDKVPRM